MLPSVVFDKKKWFVTTNMTILHESTHKSRILHGIARKSALDMQQLKKEKPAWNDFRSGRFVMAQTCGKWL
jgi:hypothetical protein